LSGHQRLSEQFAEACNPFSAPGFERWIVHPVV